MANPDNHIEIYVLFFVGVALFACLASFIVYFIVLYRNKQRKHKQEQEQLQADFSQELLKSQIEIQEQTLNHLSQEIHDNIGQVLSFVKLTLGTAISRPDEEKHQRIEESRELISRAITDLRDLSKSLSLQNIATSGLVKTMELEIDRVNKSGLVRATMEVVGQPYSLGDQRELMLFRIFQEAMNNSLKHAGANRIKISLQYSPQNFNLTIADDGAGFSVADRLGEQGGSGLKNIYNRAALIGAVALINSAPGRGCFIDVTLNPLEQHLHIDGTPQNSTG